MDTTKFKDYKYERIDFDKEINFLNDLREKFINAKSAEEAKEIILNFDKKIRSFLPLVPYAL